MSCLQDKKPIRNSLCKCMLRPDLERFGQGETEFPRCKTLAKAGPPVILIPLTLRELPAEVPLPMQLFACQCEKSICAVNPASLP